MKKVLHCFKIAFFALLLTALALPSAMAAYENDNGTESQRQIVSGIVKNSKGEPLEIGRAHV